MLTIPFAAFFNTIILLGAIQGFIVSCLLFFAQKNRRSNRILAALIFLMALAGFNLYGGYKDWFGSGLLRLIPQLIPLVVVMPIGPLIYFYVQSLLDAEFKITKQQRRHFWPVVIDVVPQLTLLVFVVCIMLKVCTNNTAPWGSFIDDYNVYADIPRWMSVTFYVWLSAKYLEQYKIKHPGALNGREVNYKWLHQFIRAFIIFQVTWLVYLVPYVIPRYTNWMLDTFMWFPVYIPMAVLIYWLGIRGYVVSYQQVLADKKVPVNNNSLPAGLIEQVTASLTKAMELDKIYFNPNCSLALVSERTGFAAKIISAVLNQHLQKSFNEFVNGYRIAAFKEKILQPETSNLTIAGIATDCGFNSLATFQRLFKEITGQSPTAYRKAAMAES